MESFHAVIRVLLARIRNLPRHVPLPEEVVIPSKNRDSQRDLYAAEPCRWGSDPASGTRSYLDEPLEPLLVPGLGPRRPQRGVRSWRRRPSAVGVTAYPTPRGLLACSPY